MIRRDMGLRAVALLVSLLLHGLLFFHMGSHAGNSDTPPPERHTTRVSFRAATAPQTVPQPPQEQELPVTVPEPEVVEASEPAPAVKPKKPSQRAERTHQPDPAPAQPPAAEAMPMEAAAAEAEKAPAAVATAGTVADPALIEQARQEYLRRLMAHIDSYKQYPRAARRRGIEGDVRVAFTLHAGGTIEGLEVSGDEHLLTQAAEEAMAAALPLPLPPDGVTLPWPLSFTMRFNLR